MAYLGVDIGGTFTDIVHLDDHGDVLSTKVSSTPPRFEEGFLAGIDEIARLRGVSSSELLSGCEAVLHGTTVATNALVRHRGARSAVITSRGHKDVLRAMRASSKVKGVGLEEVLHASQQTAPAPLVEPGLIIEVDERVDANGDVVVRLDEGQVEAAVRELAAAQIESIAVCFLWSVANPEHEDRVRQIVESIAPDIYVSCSHEASSRTGEYERFTAAAINAFLGPETAGYLRRLREKLTERGLRGRLLIMQASGGVTLESDAARLPTQTIGSGPAAGVAASAVLAAARGESNVIATDMGGTSFDVALIVEGEPVRTDSTIVNKYEFYLPRTDIRSIGSGGGSIIAFDPDSRTLRVGPDSAGARPGPVCYGLGGTRPTITDANLVLGYLDSDNFLGGAMRLDREASERALAEVGAPLGLSAVETALAARRIVNAHMADLIRQMTVERGMDPRDFAIYAYGGAGGLHVAGYLDEFGGGRAVVPLGALSTTWSAYGCASSDVVHIHERAIRLSAPFDQTALAKVFGELVVAAQEELSSDGIPAERQQFTRLVEMKYPLQIHHVEVALPDGEIDETSGAALVQRFEERYEELYGQGSAYAGAGVDIMLARVVGWGRLPQPATRTADSASMDRRQGSRRAIWQGESGPVELDTVVLAPEACGDGVEGPAIVVGPTTTILIPPAARATADEAGNVLIDV